MGALQETHDTGPIHTVYFQTALIQIDGNLFGRSVLLQAQFGMPVKIAPERNDFISIFGNLFGDFHRTPPCENLMLHKPAVLPLDHGRKHMVDHGDIVEHRHPDHLLNGGGIGGQQTAFQKNRRGSRRLRNHLPRNGDHFGFHLRRIQQAGLLDGKPKISLSFQSCDDQVTVSCTPTAARRSAARLRASAVMTPTLAFSPIISE